MGLRKVEGQFLTGQHNWRLRPSHLLKRLLQLFARAVHVLDHGGVFRAQREANLEMPAFAEPAFRDPAFHPVQYGG